MELNHYPEPIVSDEIFRGEAGTGREWRAILVRDDSGVDRLNALFSKGWYLELIEMPGLPYLVFHISAEDFGAPLSEKAPPGTRRKTEPLVLVLTRTRRIRRQRGIVLRADERGYVDLGRLDHELGEERRSIHGQAFYGMETGDCLAIVEWKGESSS